MMGSVFKSEEGRDKIRAYYNQILGFFPIAQTYADTSFGKTFVLKAGDTNKPAVILLHGSCSNSAAWLGDIPVLAERFCVFAVDILGEAGNSDENRLEPGQYALWLNELMDALQIGRAVVIGNSMGGWIALHFAAAYPQRTTALVLIASSGIVPAASSYLAQTDAFFDHENQEASSLIDPIMKDVDIPQEVRDFMTLIIENFHPFQGTLPLLSHEQMRVLTMPVLLIAGTNDVTMDAGKAADRLLTLVPHAKVTLIEGGGHVITGAMDIVMPFLSTHL